jgi:hypothetical protein
MRHPFLVYRVCVWPPYEDNYNIIINPVDQSLYSLRAHYHTTNAEILFVAAPRLSLTGSCCSFCSLFVLSRWCVSGMPLIGVAPSLEVKEEDFVDVEAEWSSGNVMLVTVGRSWFSSTNALTNNSDLNVKCPVLHRVAFPACDHVRYSVPFLVSCVPVEKE